MRIETHIYFLFVLELKVQFSLLICLFHSLCCSVRLLNYETPLDKKSTANTVKSNSVMKSLKVAISKMKILYMEVRMVVRMVGGAVK